MLTSSSTLTTSMYSSASPTSIRSCDISTFWSHSHSLTSFFESAAFISLVALFRPASSISFLLEEVPALSSMRFLGRWRREVCKCHVISPHCVDRVIQPALLITWLVSKVDVSIHRLSFSSVIHIEIFVHYIIPPYWWNWMCSALHLSMGPEKEKALSAYMYRLLFFSYCIQMANTRPAR